MQIEGKQGGVSSELKPGRLLSKQAEFKLAI
jgi:hypothetical protein